MTQAMTQAMTQTKQSLSEASWTPVCELSDIFPNTGVCALVKGQQVAIFRIEDSDTLYAIGNYCPAGKANVLSRGLLAHLGGNWTVASPLYKQHYLLETGACMENADLSVPVYQVRISGNRVEVAA